MSCLSRTELAEIALGREAGSGSSAHLQGCDRCQSELESIADTLLRGLAGAHATFDQRHERDRAGLLASLPSSGLQSRVPRPRNPFIPLIGALTMRAEIRPGRTAAAVIAVAIAVVWIGSTPRPVYAMDGVAESIRHAKSSGLRCDDQMISHGTRAGQTTGQGRNQQPFLLRSPGSCRIEFSGGTAMTGQESLTILPAGKPGIEIDRKSKRFTLQPARLGQISPLMMVDRLSTFSGQADRLLGTNEIDGKTAKGFQIDARKIDPDASPGRIKNYGSMPEQICHCRFDTR